MPSVSGGQSLALEHMTEMATTAGALDLHSLAVRIGHALHGPRNLLVERRPTAVRLKLAVRSVERGAALLAGVGAGFEVPVVLARERHLRALVEDNARFGSGERVERRVRGLGHASWNGTPSIT